MAPGPLDTARELVLSPTKRGPRTEKRRAPAATRVALVHLGNTGALGTTRRVEVWRELLAAAGAKTLEVNLLGDHRRSVPSALGALSSVSGAVAPESVVWSPRSAARALSAIAPDVVVFVTPRAFHPRLATLSGRTILDFQDLFSQSYRGRAAVSAHPLVSSAWRALAWATERFERRDHGVATVAAGFTEATRMGATWLPNVVSTPATRPVGDHARAPFDLVFFGKLSALPNVDALRSLAAIWPRLEEVVPGVSCLVAGADPTPEVRRLAKAHGWRAEEGFETVESLSARARVAVAPLRHANGIQNKVLEAAAAGLPQVLTPQALGGTAPGFPAMVVKTRESMVGAIHALLASPRQRVLLATDARRHVAEHYSAERWAPVVRSLIDGSA